jgi:lipopolysaccharide/colanic/teichoic acid biosynthesis glycosyltransferase
MQALPVSDNAALRGDMSLVGPPPMHADLAGVVRQNAEDRDMRLGVRPGITGWAQVHGIRGKASFAERIEWDKYYISHWSFWLDLKILALTVLTVLSVNRR